MAGDLLTFFFRYLLSDCLRTLVWEYMPGSKACHSHMLIGGWVGSALGDPTVPVEDLYGIKGQHTWCLFLLLNVLSSLVVISTNRLHQKAINIERQQLIGTPPVWARAIWSYFPVCFQQHAISKWEYHFMFIFWSTVPEIPAVTLKIASICTKILSVSNFSCNKPVKNQPIGSLG